MRLRARIDNNQREIADALKRCGRSVTYLHQVGGGCPDLLVGNGGRNFLLEIKKDKGSTHTDAQKRFFEFWRGQVATVRSVEEALKATQES